MMMTTMVVVMVMTAATVSPDGKTHDERSEALAAAT